MENKVPSSGENLLKRSNQSIPTIHETINQLSNAITTRVFAKRLFDLLEKDSEIVDHEKLRELALYKLREYSKSESSEQIQIIDSVTGELLSQKSIGKASFLSGSSIPNSSILAVVKSEPPKQKNPQLLRQERDEHVFKLLERLRPNKEKLRYSAERERRDYENLLSIRRRLAKENLTDDQQTDLNDLSQMLEEKERKEIDAIKKNEEIDFKDEWAEIKEKRRIFGRTEFNPVRRSTLESLQKPRLIDSNILTQERLQDNRLKNANKSLALHKAKFAEKATISFVAATTIKVKNVSAPTKPILKHSIN